MLFVYNGTADKAVLKSRVKAAAIMLIAVLVAVVGVLLIIKKQVFPGILVIFFAVCMFLYMLLRFAQVKNLKRIVSSSKLEVKDEEINGAGFLLKGSMCLPAEINLGYENIKSVKLHTPNENSYDYATLELRSKDENYFFSIGKADEAVIEIRLRLQQK